MSVFTRGGSLHTVPLDLHKDVTLFSKVLNYFTEAAIDWLGYDVHIFRSTTRQFWDPDVKGGGETYDIISKLFLSTGAFNHLYTDCCNLLTKFDC